jgi:DNA-binding transcriptional regulator YiaG
MTPQDIRRARESLGEKPEQFAKRFGVARTTILHWEKKGPPTTGPGRVHVEQVMAELESYMQEPVK